MAKFKIDEQLIEDGIEKLQATVTNEGQDNEGEFEGQGRSRDLVQLEEDDVIYVPKDAKARAIPIRGGKPYQGYVCQLVRGDEKLAVAITPGMFSRSFLVVDKDTGEPITPNKRVSCSGTASDLFFSGTSLDDQMKKTRGHRLTVTKVDRFYSYNSDFMTKPKETPIYEIEDNGTF